MNSSLGWLILLWLVIGVATIWTRWRIGRPGVGLVTAYLIYLAWIHWVPAVLYILPWYWPLNSTEIVAFGFEQSLVGVTGFALGAIGFSIWRHRTGASSEVHATPAASADQRLPALLFWLGLLSYFVLTPLLGRLPTIGAAATVLSNLIYAGVVLVWWQASRTGHSSTRFLLLILAGVWPLITVSGQGFLGAGLMLPTLLFLFIARTARRPVFLVFAGLGMVYLAMSIAVSYSINRATIRSVVWDEQASQQEQLAASLLIFEQFQWLDIRNSEHLDRIDMHTNQNHLVGLAVQRQNQGINEYTYGSTLADAVIMLVPRVLWPEKPIRVGGSAYVTQFTGISFGGGTSVGMGQIMEFYVNFGMIGIFLGMFLLGVIITALDEASARSLQQSNWLGFALWYVPALSLLQTGNNMVTLVAGFMASWLVIYGLIRFWLAHAQNSDAPARSESQTLRRRGWRTP